MDEAKILGAMSTAELGKLFPVTLSGHDEAWVSVFRREANVLAPVLRGYEAAVHHVGSTSIPGIVAKPIIDILVEIKACRDEKALIDGIVATGYFYTPQQGHPERLHLMFVKGYSLQGMTFPGVHLHIRRWGDRDEVLFRDYLLRHDEARREYAALKTGLAERFHYDREAYTAGKSAFVRRIVDLAAVEQEDEAS